MQRSDREKDIQLLERHFTDLSRAAYERDMITFSDFLNLDQQNILHMLPKDRIFTRILSFGGYDMAERRMAAFIPDALYLCWGEDVFSAENFSFPFSPVKIEPRNRRFSEQLSHRDYLGALLNLGIERAKMGDILISDDEAVVFVHKDMVRIICEELVRIRHTSVNAYEVTADHIKFEAEYEEIRGTIASVRLDSLLPLAFSSSRSKLSGLIEGAKVYVNSRLITSNAYEPKEGDIISVRGYGKFCFKGVGQRTRKNRISVIIQKYM